MLLALTEVLTRDIINLKHLILVIKVFKFHEFTNRLLICFTVNDLSSSYFL